VVLLCAAAVQAQAQTNAPATGTAGVSNVYTTPGAQVGGPGAIPAAKPANTNSPASTNRLPRPLSVQQPIRPAPEIAPKGFSTSEALAWDSRLKEQTVSNDVESTVFKYWATNVSRSNVVVLDTHASCECTVAKLPSQPWVLPPGSNGLIEVTVNLKGKSGILTKFVELILSNQPVDTLAARVNIQPPPPMSDQERSRNLLVSRADAQAVFKGSCAKCHLDPATGRTGEMLYSTLCGVCHEASPERRASMVPNLHSLTKPTDYDFWKNTISGGKTNTLMPAFIETKGGPLTEMQVDSIAQFLAINISRNYKPKASNAPVPPPRTEHKPFPTNKFGTNTAPPVAPAKQGN